MLEPESTKVTYKVSHNSWVIKTFLECSTKKVVLLGRHQIQIFYRSKKDSIQTIKYFLAMLLEKQHLFPYMGVGQLLGGGVWQKFSTPLFMHNFFPKQKKKKCYY
jgi:hypothetical protein